MTTDTKPRPKFAVSEIVDLYNVIYDIWTPAVEVIFVEWFEGLLLTELSENVTTGRSYTGYLYITNAHPVGTFSPEEHLRKRPDFNPVLPDAKSVVLTAMEAYAKQLARQQEQQENEE